MTCLPAVHVLVTVLGVGVGVVLGAGGCAGGKLQQDAAPVPDDAEVQSDAEAQMDAPLDAVPDAPTPQDGAAHDAQVDFGPQQDAPHDAVLQLDAQRDSTPTGCTNDDMCNPDGGAGGRSCFTSKGVCYKPGTCVNSLECGNNSTCNLTLIPPGFFCSCNELALPQILCRPNETCVPPWGGTCQAN